MRTANSFGDAGLRLITELHEGARPVIDLSGVTFMDSTGLRALLSIRSHAPEALVLRRPAAAVRRLLEVAVPGVFTIE